MEFTFEQWREQARTFLQQNRRPEEIDWSTGTVRKSLFGDPEQTDAMVHGEHTVPGAFLELAKRVACHRSPDRFPLLYRLLWRLTHGEPYLLEVETDLDVHQANQMRKAVKRDAHKMKAFVRFRKLETEKGDSYIAWHRPDHRITRLVAPFFSRRFPEMNWTILTPDESVHWDLSRLTYGPGVPADQAPDADALEDLWKAYYRSTFNPARVNVKLMKQEMPVRHWATLPEAELIPELLAEADARVDSMVRSFEGIAQTAGELIPEQFDLESLRKRAETCTACPLHQPATQTVFGQGPENAKLVFVGEQPGDEEDRQGQPFVGPAGRLLNSALSEAGIDRNEIYLTNTVKHFKFVQHGQRRLHKKPNAREISACRPWLEAELQFLKPAGLLLLGATAAQALLGRDFRITQNRGQCLQSKWCKNTIATWHPAAILRASDSVRQAEMTAQFVSDLKLAVTVSGS